MTDTLKRDDIVRGLQDLGLQKGDRVLVHSSLVALGEVEGGPDTVIDALLEAVGPEGMVVVPTFACKPPFDRRTSATALGAIPDRFWRRPEAVRSLHPTHSVAAIGPGAEDLIKDHEKAPTAYAEGTPYYKLAKSGGKILLMGCDQDRNTTLHAAEALAKAPYLTDIEGVYIDDNGNAVTIPIAAMAGPHRNFIGLDSLFRALDIMKMGRIGGAMCRLMDAGQMLDTALDAMVSDPAAVLCDNPACADCVMQRGKIKATWLAKENFILAAVAGDISDDADEILHTIQGEGISAVEITPAEYRWFGRKLMNSGVKIVGIRSFSDDTEAAELAAELCVPLIVPAASKDEFDQAAQLARNSKAEVFIMNDGAPSSFYAELYTSTENAPRLAFNPAQFAKAGEKPFLQIFYKGKLRKNTSHFYIDDGTFDGTSTLPGYGNGEVKEIISMLRCRSYGGVMTLRAHDGGIDNFKQSAAAFWDLLETM